MKCWVISFGGVCCSHIIKQLEKSNIHTNLYGDFDKLKHLHSPNSTKYSQQIDKFDKIIYIYNDPLLAILSHFRRNWVFKQHGKINKKPLLKASVCNSYLEFEKHTISTGKDVFGCSTHFEEWYNYEHKKPILFIDIRDENFEHQIQSFLNTPVKFEFEKRNTNKTICKDDMIAIYDDVDTKIKNKIKLLHNHS